jgi:hypothetical protein
MALSDDEPEKIAAFIQQKVAGAAVFKAGN